MRKLLALFLLLLIVACSSHTAPQTKETTNALSSPPPHSGASLQIHADPRQGFAPLRVTFHAVLSGISDSDANFHCLKEEWDFGDGAISSQTPNCEPLVAGGKIEMEFITDHLYDNDGNYTIGFTLGDKNKIRSNKVTVTVLENLRNANGE
jgi:hypothetical protein